MMTLGLMVLTIGVAGALHTVALLAEGIPGTVLVREIRGRRRRPSLALLPRRRGRMPIFETMLGANIVVRLIFLPSLPFVQREGAGV